MDDIFPYSLKNLGTNDITLATLKTCLHVGVSSPSSFVSLTSSQVVEFSAFTIGSFKPSWDPLHPLPLVIQCYSLLSGPLLRLVLFRLVFS